MMGTASRAKAAVAEAQRRGLVPHHLSLVAEDWPAGLPALTVKPAFRAAGSVLWAMSRDGMRLVPIQLDADASGSSERTRAEDGLVRDELNPPGEDAILDHCLEGEG